MVFVCCSDCNFYDQRQAKDAMFYFLSRRVEFWAPTRELLWPWRPAGLSVLRPATLSHPLVPQEARCIFGLPHLLWTGTMKCLCASGLVSSAPPRSPTPVSLPILFPLSHRCSQCHPTKTPPDKTVFCVSRRRKRRKRRCGHHGNRAVGVITQACRLFGMFAPSAHECIVVRQTAVAY